MNRKSHHKKGRPPPAGGAERKQDRLCTLIDADQLTALGITTVKQLGTSSFSEGVLTLNFTDATAIEAGMTIPGLEIPGIPSSILMGK